MNVIDRLYLIDGVDHAVHSRLAEATAEVAAGMAAVEVIDIEGPGLNSSAASALVGSFRRTGFAVITGHGVADALFDDLREVSSGFFSLPADEKALAGFPSPDIIRGWEPVPGDDDREVNLMESFLINRLEPVDDQPPGSLEHRLWRWPNVWPARPVRLRCVFEAYYRAMEALGNRLLEMTAVGLGLPAGTFTAMMGSHFSNLAANWYPPLDEKPTGGRLRNRIHTDHGALTLLYRPDEPGGLEVFAHRQWWQLPFVPGSLVINVGDVLDRLTNGVLPATPHRVVNPEDDAARSGRSSYAFFQQPDPGLVVTPITGLLGTSRDPAYSPVVCGPHISIKEFGAARFQEFQNSVPAREEQP